jgi:hypothetical protein
MNRIQRSNLSHMRTRSCPIPQCAVATSQSLAFLAGITTHKQQQATQSLPLAGRSHATKQQDTHSLPPIEQSAAWLSYSARAVPQWSRVAKSNCYSSDQHASSKNCENSN